MNTNFEDTIVATASAPGPGARGIIRLSGPSISNILRQVFLPAEGEPFPQRVSRRIAGSLQLQGPDGIVTLPAHLYCWPTGKSYTGESLAELHLIGSPPILNVIIRKLCDVGARHAKPGEFTMRAFLNGRVDLVQAEAVLGVIDAHSPEQLTTALSQLAGGISSQMQSLREQLLLHLADLEAGLDFVEEDIDFVSRPDLVGRLGEAVEILSRLARQSSERLLALGSRTVVLAGLPNAGKSTLLNALVGAEAALVSPLAGTTRDFVRGSLQLNDVTLELLDTAGWEEDPQGINALVESQRQRQIKQADLILWCSAADRTPGEQRVDGALYRKQSSLGIPLLRVITKSDLLHDGTSPDSAGGLLIAARFPESLEQLKQRLYTLLTDFAEAHTELIASTTVRCQQSLSQALSSAVLALQLAKERGGDELIALELREVLNHLGQILGAVYTDDILDRIFSRFCIGK